jgi:hypothetical protein
MLSVVVNISLALSALTVAVFPVAVFPVAVFPVDGILPVGLSVALPVAVSTAELPLP